MSVTKKIKKSVSFSDDTQDPSPAERCGGCQKRHINMIMCVICLDKLCHKCLINETCRKCYLEYKDAYEKLIDNFLCLNLENDFDCNFDMFD